MHGIIFQELQHYVETKLGREAWVSLTENAGLSSKVFLPTQAYPDEEMLALVAAASAATGSPADAILQDFGKHIVAALFKVFGTLIQPDWKTLDVLEYVEENIHTAVRVRNPDAEPPALRSERVAENEVVIEYNSARKICGVAKGICAGLADHYGEKIETTEETCMLQGADKCTLRVKRLT